MIDTAAQPLAGLKILVTRPRAQAAEFAAKLEALGAATILLPAIEIAAPPKKGELWDILARLAEFDWLVLTSVNGVAAVGEIIREIPPHVRIAAIGPATARAVADRFRTPDTVPAEYLSEAIAPALGEVAGKRILLARADIARNQLTEILQAKGAEVVEVAAYSIRRAESKSGVERPDVITVTSSSAVRHTVETLRDLDNDAWISEIPWVCIGPVTAETARELGCNVAAVAAEYTTDGLVQAIVRSIRT